jgi:hypothetical protein
MSAALISHSSTSTNQPTTHPAALLSLLTTSSKSPSDLLFAARATAAIASKWIPVCFTAILLPNKAGTSPAPLFKTFDRIKYFSTATADGLLQESYASKAFPKQFHATANNMLDKT